jgi:hypothetical protein
MAGEKGVLVFESEEEIRNTLDEIGQDGEEAVLTPGPNGGFILTGEDAEAYANHRGIPLTDVSDIGTKGGEPVLDAIIPTTAELGSADLVLTCTGTGFRPESVILFAGQPEPINFISSLEITTIVKPSLAWGAVTVPVAVKNDDLVSMAQDFTFTEPAAPGRKGSKRR